jgi:hypothetical protein
MLAAETRRRADVEAARLSRQPSRDRRYQEGPGYAITAVLAQQGLPWRVTFGGKWQEIFSAIWPRL